MTKLNWLTFLSLLSFLMMGLDDARCDSTDATHLIANRVSRQELLTYEQKKLQLLDPVGDLALVIFDDEIKQHLIELATATKTLADYVKNDRPIQCDLIPEECTPQAIEAYKKVLRTKKPFVPSQERPIRYNEFLEMLAQVMVEETALGISPKEGAFHEWSSEFEEEYSNQIIPDLYMPKLLVALVGGVSSRFLRTDQEEPLIREILKMPEDSITLSWFFRKSYQLNQGNVYLTLLTAENVLSRENLNRDREALPVTRRLKSFSNGEGDESDKFGIWYHFFGTLLYGYYMEYSSGWYQAPLVAQVELLGARFLGVNRGKQKEWSNLQGAELGADLRQVMHEELWKELKPDSKNCDESFYLTRGSQGSI